MIRSVASFAVRFPVTVTMLILAIVLLGFISFNKLGIELFPDLNNPRLFVEITAGENPPEEIEEQYVDRIEAIAVSQSGVVNVSSVCRVGVAQIKVEYSWSKDMDEAFLDLSKALSSFNQDQNIDELNITQHDPNSQPVMLVALQYDGETTLNDLRKVAENYIRNDLIRLEGVAAVEIEGAESQEVVVETNEYLMKSFNISLGTISNRIRSFNQNISGGSVTEMGRRYVVKGLSELTDVSELENIIVSMQNTSSEGDPERVPVLLKDVANVYFGNKDMKNMVFLNGAPCIGMSIYKETRYNTVKAVEDLKNALVTLEQSLPDYKFTVIQDQGRFITASIGEVSNSAVIGAVLAILVLLFFLRKVRTTIIISTAIPVSILACFTLMYFQGLTLNLMTLGGLALGAGMLVDNSIVVIENIFRNHEEGRDEREAAVHGTSQVGGAIIASTITTVVVFLPIVYIHGASGELFKEQAMTVTYTLICSLLVAMIAIPMLFSVFYRKGQDKVAIKHSGSMKFDGYRRFLSGVLDKRGWILGGAALLILCGWFMMKSLGSVFMPETATREFYVDIRLPEGTRIGRTADAIHVIEQSIRDIGGEDIDNIYSQAGPSSSLTSGETSVFEDQNTGIIKVGLREESLKDPAAVIDQLNSIYSDTPDLMITCREQETALRSILGDEESPVIIEIKGDDMDVLEDLLGQAMDRVNNVPELINLATSVEGGAPEVEISIDRFRAGIMNLNINEVVSSVAQKLEGVNAGQMDIDGEMNDITLKFGKTDLNELRNMTLTVGGVEVPLQEVAEITVGSSPKEILHNDQTRIVRITAGINGDIPLDKLSEKIQNRLSEVSLPVNYSLSISGQEAQRKESMRNLSFALILSLVLVYMVLAAQFESLIHPFTIILTIPLAVTGAFATFFILGRPLNIMAYIGIIMLGGIAVNNSILLIDAIIQLRKEGLGLKEAILTGAMRRIRPILMTSLTTILALLPLTLGFGESSSMQSSMAWAVIGGLFTSTILSLIVIPCVYMVFSSQVKGNINNYSPEK